jgi:hypothetical protein
MPYVLPQTLEDLETELRAGMPYRLALINTATRWDVYSGDLRHAYEAQKRRQHRAELIVNWTLGLGLIAAVIALLTT